MATLHKNLHSRSLWHYLPPSIKIYEPTTKFSVHKYNGVKALQKSRNCKNSSFADNYIFDHKNAGV